MSNNKKAAAVIVKFVLRIPPKLHRRIKRDAKANNTSMNKEIVNLLESKALDRKKVAYIIDLLEQ